MCGYKEQIGGVKVNTIMTNYVDKITGEIKLCCNSLEDEVGGFIKQSLFGAVSNKGSVAPAAPAAPTITNRLTNLPPAAPLSTTPVVQLQPTVVADVQTPEPIQVAPKPNPFANVGQVAPAPVPNGGPI